MECKPSDNGTMEIIVGCYQEQFDGRLKSLRCDHAYATGWQTHLAECWGLTLYAPFKEPVSHKGQIPKSAFKYLGEEDCYVCPLGKRLQLKQTRTQQRGGGERVQLKVYQAETQACKECPRKATCCGKSQSGRTINRSEYEEPLQRLQARMETSEAKQEYKKRKQTVELAFADQKKHRKMREFYSRGQERAESQVGLMVMAHNGLIVEKARAKWYAQASRGECERLRGEGSGG